RDALHHFINSVCHAVAHLPGIGIVAVLAAQYTAGQEQGHARTGTIHGCHQFPGVHRTDVASSHGGKGCCAVLAAGGGGDSRGGHGFFLYSAPWKVRLRTSICCSRVRRTKLTAYPETRMVNCGESCGFSIASSSVSRLRTLMFRWNPS